MKHERGEMRRMFIYSDEAPTCIIEPDLFRIYYFIFSIWIGVDLWLLSKGGKLYNTRFHR